MLKEKEATEEVERVKRAALELEGRHSQKSALHLTWAFYVIHLGVG